MYSFVVNSNSIFCESPFIILYTEINIIELLYIQGTWEIYNTQLVNAVQQSFSAKKDVNEKICPT